MFKRFVKIFAVIMAVCIMLTSCSFVEDMPLLPEKAVDSLIGSVRVLGDLMDQIKEEGLGSISSVFSSDDDEASKPEEGASSSSSSSSSEDSSQSEE